MSKFYEAAIRSRQGTAAVAPAPAIEEHPASDREEDAVSELPHVPLYIAHDAEIAGDVEPEAPPSAPPDAGPRTAETAARHPARRPPADRDEKVEIQGESIHPSYERIIQKLLTSRRSPRQGVILVSGSIAREGASTVARNTALALGIGLTEQVVLVDGNVRTPSQHEAFGTELTSGLCEVFQGTVSLANAVRPDVAPGLSLLTAGGPVVSPPHVLTIAAVQGITMALNSLFDWVIIDGPPLTTCPEAASLATAAGGAVLVVRAEKTRREIVEEALRVLGDSEVDVLGAVLNRRRFHIPEFIYRRL